MKAWKAFLLVPILVAGCAHGFDRAALQERLTDGSLQVSDAAITEARSMKPQLKLPCRVAYYLNPAGRGDWRWTPDDRAVLEPLAAALVKDGIAADVFPLPEMLTGEKPNFKDLRVAAAKCGADVLLVINGAAQTDSYKNPASMLYLTIVGGYVVPGSHVDALFLMEGCLFDVDNGYVYAGTQAEGEGKIIRPTFLIEEKDAISRAKTQAVARFSEELLTRMRTLAGNAHK